MARALTSDELGYLRRDNQHSELYLAILDPAVVWCGQINSTFAGYDEIHQVTFDVEVYGTYVSVLEGMTLWVGTAPYTYNMGMVRARTDGSTWVDSVALIGEESEIAWVDNCYITAVKEFALWPRHLRTTLTKKSYHVYMDYDIVYSNQHANFMPVPIMGTHAVLWLTGASVSVTFDGTNSWVSGSTISAYLWTCAGSVSGSGGTGATNVFTFDAAGTYLVRLKVTSAADVTKTMTGYRYVFVYDATHLPVTTFKLNSCSGDYDTGGWNFKITMYDDALTSQVRDRALVILFSKDWYGSLQTSIGPISGRENIICVGWINGESIEWNAPQPEMQANSVSFDVQGAQWWFDQMIAFPCGVENPGKTPTVWTEINNLTVDKGLHHFLHWRSTATAVMDIYPSNDVRKMKSLESGVSTLWTQMLAMSEAAILAHPCVDRYGRMFVRIDSQYFPTADRTGLGIPTVQALSKADWHDSLTIEGRPAAQIGNLEIYGVVYIDDDTMTPIGSISPGNVYGRIGKQERIDGLALYSQTLTNAMCGCIYGTRNNPYPTVSFELAANNRGADICPYQYLTLTVASTDTERGIVWTNKKVIPRHIAYRYDYKSMTFTVEVDAETESVPGLGATKPLPGIPNPPVVPPPLVPPPWPTIPQHSLPLSYVFVTNGTKIYYCDNVMAAVPHWRILGGGLPPTGTISKFWANQDTKDKVIAHVASMGVYALTDMPSGAWHTALDAAMICGITGNVYEILVAVAMDESTSKFLAYTWDWEVGTFIGYQHYLWHSLDGTNWNIGYHVNGDVLGFPFLVPDLSYGGGLGAFHAIISGVDHFYGTNPTATALYDYGNFSCLHSRGYGTQSVWCFNGFNHFLSLDNGSTRGGMSATPSDALPVMDAATTVMMVHHNISLDGGGSFTADIVEKPFYAAGYWFDVRATGLYVSPLANGSIWWNITGDLDDLIDPLTNITHVDALTE